MNRCPEGGVLVGGEGRVPADPSEYAPWRVMTHPDIGCARLVCSACGEAVRDGQVGLQEPIPSALELFEATDWGALAATYSSRRRRTYACRCQLWSFSRKVTFDDPDRDLGGRIPPGTWECAGHPLPTLPLVVDGVSIEEHTDLPALARRVCDGWLPSEAPVRDLYVLWLARLYERLRGLPQAEGLATTMSDLLEDPDSYRVGAALTFFEIYPEAATALANLAAQAVAPATWPVRLRDTSRPVALAAVLAKKHRTMGLSAEESVAFRQLVRRSGTTVSSDDIRALAASDPESVAREAGALAEAHPKLIGPLIEGLADQGAAYASIGGAAMAGSRGLDVDELERWLDKRHPNAAWAVVVRDAMNGRSP